MLSLQENLPPGAFSLDIQKSIQPSRFFSHILQSKAIRNFHLYKGTSVSFGGVLFVCWYSL